MSTVAHRGSIGTAASMKLACLGSTPSGGALFYRRFVIVIIDALPGLTVLGLYGDMDPLVADLPPTFEGRFIEWICLLICIRICILRALFVCI